MVQQDMRARLLKEVRLSAPSHRASCELLRAVLDHLVHTCCPKSAQAVAAAAAAKRSWPGSEQDSSSFVISQDDIDAMSKRRSVSALLLEGLVEDVCPCS
jgi:hypothetical protein